MGKALKYIPYVHLFLKYIFTLFGMKNKVQAQYYILNPSRSFRPGFENSVAACVVQTYSLMSSIAMVIK